MPDGLRRPPKTPRDRLAARSSGAATRVAAFWGCSCSISDCNPSLWWLTSGVFGAVAAVVVALLAPPIMGRRRTRVTTTALPRPSPGRSRRASPRSSETYELVGILRGDRLIIYLDRFATNEPVTTANIAVTIGDATEAVNAEWAAEGTYALTSPRFADRGADRAGVLDHRRTRRGPARRNADGAAERGDGDGSALSRDRAACGFGSRRWFSPRRDGGDTDRATAP